MTLATLLKKAAHMLPLIFMVAANANADPLTIGQCGPADDIKAELTKEGYSNYFVYDVKLFNNELNAARWVRESIYGDDTMKKGFHVGRRGEQQDEMCILAAAADIILADNAEQAKTGKIDPRFYKNGPKSDVQNGLNYKLNAGAQNIKAYPNIQMRIIQKDGSQGYMTIATNPITGEGGRLYSDFNGSVVAMNTQLEAGSKPMTGYTPVGQAILTQIKSAGQKQAPQ